MLNNKNNHLFINNRQRHTQLYVYKKLNLFCNFKIKVQMKHLLLIFTALLLLNCCNNDDDNTPTDPISLLPPATQTGENTFGALLDGEPFIPGGGTNPLDCVYQLINGERFFNLQGNKRDEDFNLIRLSLSTNARELEEGQNYQLTTNEEGNVFGAFFLNTTQTFTDGLESVGSITKLDLNTQIISGNFQFNIIDSEGTLRTIRNGRFDMQFTQ